MYVSFKIDIMYIAFIMHIVFVIHFFEIFIERFLFLALFSWFYVIFSHLLKVVLGHFFFCNYRHHICTCMFWCLTCNISRITEHSVREVTRCRFFYMYLHTKCFVCFLRRGTNRTLVIETRLLLILPRSLTSEVQAKRVLDSFFISPNPGVSYLKCKHHKSNEQETELENRIQEMKIGILMEVQNDTGLVFS